MLLTTFFPVESPDMHYRCLFFHHPPGRRDTKPRNSSHSCMAVSLLCRRAPKLAVHVQALTCFNCNCLAKDPGKALGLTLLERSGNKEIRWLSHASVGRLFLSFVTLY